MPAPDERPDVPLPDSEEARASGGESLSEALGQDVASDQPATGMRSEKPRWRRWITIRDDPAALERLFLGLACILLVLLVWHLLTNGEQDERIVNPVALPSVPETARSFPELWFDRALMRNAFASLSRVLGGFALAAAVAIPLGVLAGCYPRFHAFARPLSIFGRNIPVAALIPLTLIWFGLGDLQKMLFIFLAAVAFVFFDTTQALRRVPGHFLDTAYTLGARSNWRQGLRGGLLFGLAYAGLALLAAHWLSGEDRTLLASLGARRTWVFGGIGLAAGTLMWLPVQSHQAISKVLFPLALPSIVNSLRLLFGLAFGYIMLAEVINAEAGLGKIILMSQRRGPREHIYLCLIAIALLAFLIDRLIMWIQRRAFPYASHAGH